MCKHPNHLWEEKSHHISDSHGAERGKKWFIWVKIDSSGSCSRRWEDSCKLWRILRDCGSLEECLGLCFTTWQLEDVWTYSAWWVMAHSSRRDSWENIENSNWMDPSSWLEGQPFIRPGDLIFSYFLPSQYLDSVLNGRMEMEKRFWQAQATVGSPDNSQGCLIQFGLLNKDSLCSHISSNENF